MSSMYGGQGQGTGQPSRSGATGESIPEGYKKASVQNFTPEMMDLFKQMFGHVGQDSYLSKLAAGDEETFNQIEAPALKQFAGVQGNLASRFSGMGTGGRKSSGFGNTINQAGSDFAMQLQAQRQGLMSQALRDLMGFSNQILNQKPYENSLVEEPTSFWNKYGSGAAGGAAGAASGAAIGSLVPGIGTGIGATVGGLNGFYHGYSNA